MKIAFLLMWGDNTGGTNGAVITQAGYLVRHHEVQIISVLKTRPKPFYPVAAGVRFSHLIDETGDVPRPTRKVRYGDDDALRALATTPSEIVSREWERQLNRLTDLEIEYALRNLDADVIVSTSPPLMHLVDKFAPSRTLFVHQEHRTSEERTHQLPPLLAAAPRVDVLAVLTERTRGWFSSVLGDAAPRIEVIPNALKNQVRPRSSLQANRIVTAGRLVAGKQVTHLVRAFGDLVERHPDWSLDIFGDGPQENTLRRLIIDLGLYNHVRLMGTTPHMAREWAKASIAAMSSRQEGWPLVIPEAFAAGVPFVSYDAPNGPAELITHEHNGLLVPLDSIKGLTHALDRLMSDPEERARMGAAALKTADLYTEEKVLGRWVDLYEELAGPARQHDRLAARLDRAATSTANPALTDGVFTSSDSSSASFDAVHAATPELVPYKGRLWHVVDGLTADEMDQRNLDLVVDALEDRGIPYLVIERQADGYALSIEEEHRQAAIDVFVEKYGNDAVYATPLINGEPVGGSVLMGDIAEMFGLERLTGLRINALFMSPERTFRVGTTTGCHLQFWTRVDSVLQWPRPNGTLEPVPDEALTEAEMSIGGRRYRSAAPFVSPRIDTIDFPIDAVYTWVDSTDEAWQQRRAAAVTASAGIDHHAEATSAARFRSQDELRYSLRSLVMYAPWIRHVYLVTDQQTPSWLDTANPHVTMVDHKEIFRDGACLPTFNSHAIETQLHHIEGLSEHYLYINDDVFFGRRVRPELFFLSNGIARFFPSPLTVPFGPPTAEDLPHFSAGKNVRRLIEQAFGRTTRSIFKHTPHPQLRSVLTELEERFPEDVSRTAASRFRHHDDVPVPSQLHHYYAYLTSRAVSSAISYAYLDVARTEHQHKLSRLLRARGYDVFCLNDNLEDETASAQERIVHNLLDAYYPFPSEFEVDATRPTMKLARHDE